MKYKITIERMRMETRKNREWVKYTDDPNVEKPYKYEEYPEETEVSEKIYEQTKDGEIYLMEVITAFNTTPADKKMEEKMKEELGKQDTI